MNESAPQDADTDPDDADVDVEDDDLRDATDDAHADAHARTDPRARIEHGHVADDHVADDHAQDSEYDESSEEDSPEPNSHFTQDMENLQNCFAGFRHKYRLIKRIGEGLLSPAPDRGCRGRRGRTS